MVRFVFNVGNCKKYQEYIEIGKKGEKEDRHKCNNCGV